MNDALYQKDADLDAALLALADPVRRAILHRLGQTSELRVTDIAQPFSISLNSVSKHIQLLERAHFVERRRAGREFRLRYNATPMHKIQQWIDTQQSFWKAGLEALAKEIDQPHDA